MSFLNLSKKEVERKMNEYAKFKNYILKYQLGKTLENVSFKCLTSLKVGGTCKVLYMPDDIDALIIARKYIKKNNLNYFIIGAGTNLLVDDKEFDEVVISLKNLKRYFVLKEEATDVYIYVESGIRMPSIALMLARRNFINMEFMSTIPGTIGGAIVMNAGAYGMQMSDILDSVTYIDDLGEVKKLKLRDDHSCFSYRNSIFKNKGYIILSCVLKLKKANPGYSPMDYIRKITKEKKSSQPLELNNAGSTFKNQEIPAWKIIDELGFRGYKIGDAMVSNKHANFIVNTADASFNDIYTLITKIKEASKEKLNIDLECEWVIKH